ncbi:UNVERIFIED_CONTAM: hypothetical protein HDU68_011597, partial [Siphonaria sp. JEL0065]
MTTTTTTTKTPPNQTPSKQQRRQKSNLFSPALSKLVNNLTPKKQKFETATPTKLVKKTLTHSVQKDKDKKDKNASTPRLKVMKQ